MTKTEDYTSFEKRMIEEIFADVKFLLLLLKRDDIPKDIADQASSRFNALMKLGELITAHKRKEARADGKEPPPPLLVDNRTRYERAEERLKRAGLSQPRKITTNP